MMRPAVPSGVARIVDNADVRTKDAPAGAPALEPVVERRTGDGHAFGHAVAGQNRRLEPRLQPAGRRGEQIARSVADEPQPVCRIGSALAFLQDAVVHGGRGVVPVEACAAIELVPEQSGVEAVRIDHAAARQQRGEEVANNAAHVEQRHHVVAAILRSQLQRRRDTGCAHAQIAETDGHQLLAPGGARGEQLQRHVIRSVEFRSFPVAGDGSAAEIEQTRLVRMVGNLEHGDAQGARRLPDVFEIVGARHDDGFCADGGKIGGDLALGTPRVQGRGDATHADGQQANRQFGPFGERDGAPVPRPQP
jgi:hypothetical protein